MRFRNDAPLKRELTDAVEEDHLSQIAAVAAERIKSVHEHEDGSRVELHEVSSQEFISQSIKSSIDGKLQDEIYSKEAQPTQKIEYERNPASGQNVYGQSASHKETVMMGCNCGAEWTVTGGDVNSPGELKIEGYRTSSAGYASIGEPGGYAAGGSYK